MSRDTRPDYRERIIAMMGGKCVRCGFNDSRALQIDHVFGGGCQDKRLTLCPAGITRVYEELKAGKIQLLCANCNWIKRHERSEVKTPNRGRKAVP